MHLTDRSFRIYYNFTIKVIIDLTQKFTDEIHCFSDLNRFGLARRYQMKRYKEWHTRFFEVTFTVKLKTGVVKTFFWNDLNIVTACVWLIIICRSLWFPTFSLIFLLRSSTEIIPCQLLGNAMLISSMKRNYELNELNSLVLGSALLRKLVFRFKVKWHWSRSKYFMLSIKNKNKRQAL